MIAMLSPSKPLEIASTNPSSASSEPSTSDTAVSVAPVPTIRAARPGRDEYLGPADILGQLLEIGGQQPLVRLAADEFHRTR